MASEPARQQQRRNLFYYLPVTDRLTGTSLGRIVDITTGGMLIISREVHHEGELLHAALDLDNELLDGLHGIIEFDLVVRWSRRDVNPDYIVTGSSFVTVSEAQRTAVQDLIGRIAFQE